MGCASSKRVDVQDFYRPAPASFALFDVGTVDEPWLAAVKVQDEENNCLEKQPTTILPIQLLQKLDSVDRPPSSWSEVSKALEDLKPTLHSMPINGTIAAPAKKPAAPAEAAAVADSTGKMSSMLATLPAELPGYRPVRDNAFILRDKASMNSAAGAEAAAKWKPRSPLEGYPERCPPGSGGGVVLYSTTLRGVRRTFEDCEEARRVVYAHAVDAGGVAVDERDVALHGGFLKELRELVGEDAVVPRLFVMGRYVGGMKEIAELSENGKLREMMRWAARRGDAGKDARGCEGCGGARFVPCWECGGSRKVVTSGGKAPAELCGQCNENGLAMCPLCH